MLKITLIAIAGLIILGAASLAIDYYLYSWTSFIKPLGCKHKSIYVEPNNNQLKLEYDMIQIGNEIKTNPNYKIEKPYIAIELYTERSLMVSRMYGDVKYNIWFEKGRTSDGTFTVVNFNNYNSDALNNSSLNKREKPTTPNYSIKKNIYQMIDEMPFNDAQKSELKSKVEILDFRG